MALCIKTPDGWKLVGGPLAPIEPPKKWWNFPASDAYDTLMRRERPQTEGQEMIGGTTRAAAYPHCPAGGRLGRPASMGRR